MYCPNCREDCPESAKFCPQCGTKLPASQPLGDPAPIVPEALPGQPPLISESPVPQTVDPIPEAMPQPSLEHVHIPASPPPSPRRGTHWIPLTIMAVMVILGLVLFFALPYESDGTAAYYADGESDTPWFENIDGTLRFYDYLYTGPAEVTVPDTVDGLPVTSIGPFCFSDCEWITTVILPDTVEEIGFYAFGGCTSLRGIYLPEGLTYIGSEAFYDCAALEAVCIPSTVESIESGAFDGCENLNYILYSGIHSHWMELYQDYISRKTQVYCTDGTFLHRGFTP